MYRLLIILYILFFNAVNVFAALEINEVMYDPEGADTDREWVEIYNNGSSDILINDWYFFENNTYHGLAGAGFDKLGAGQYALIVKNIDAAKSELGSGLRYIKSSFSLNNTGEELSIADNNKTTQDSYIYSAELGANGDGFSLQKISHNWSAGIPSPGIENNHSSQSELEYITNTNNSTTTNNNESSEKVYVKSANYYKADLQVPDVIVAQADFNIAAEVTHFKDSKSTNEINGYFYLNFGDGKSFESRERVNTSHSYRRGGNYVLFFEYYSSYLAFDAGEDPLVSVTKNITVTEHALSIEKVNPFDGIVIKNNTSKKINLDAWKIIWGKYSYIFPRHSYIQAKKEINIIFDTLGFFAEPSYDKPIQLLSNGYKPVSVFPIYKKTAALPKTETILVRNDVPGETRVTTEIHTESEQELSFFGEPSSYLDDYLSKNPDKIAVDFGEGDIGEQGNINEKNPKDNLFYYVFGVVILMLGAGRYIHGKSDIKKSEDFGTIEIIE